MTPGGQAASRGPLQPGAALPFAASSPSSPLGPPGEAGPPGPGFPIVGPAPGRTRGIGWRALVATAAVAAVFGGLAGGGLALVASDDETSPPLGGDAATERVDAPVELSQSVASIAASALPSVVTIEVRAGIQGSTGSGVGLRPDGYILTNNHVVAPAGQE
nr:hypothetical protein [Micromonospora sp. DSM 115978]